MNRAQVIGGTLSAFVFLFFFYLNVITTDYYVDKFMGSQGIKTTLLIEKTIWASLAALSAWIVFTGLQSRSLIGMKKET